MYVFGLILNNINLSLSDMSQSIRIDCDQHSVKAYFNDLDRYIDNHLVYLITNNERFKHLSSIKLSN